jgi:hypothetical protein
METGIISSSKCLQVKDNISSFLLFYALQFYCKACECGDQMVDAFYVPYKV